MIPGTPAGQQVDIASKPTFPPRTSSFARLTASRVQGSRMGLLMSAMRGVTCRPVLAASALLVKGWAGSKPTGPGPEAGGSQSAPTEVQPAVLPCEKSGMAVCGLSAPGADEAAPAEATIRNIVPANSRWDRKRNRI